MTILKGTLHLAVHSSGPVHVARGQSDASDVMHVHVQAAADLASVDVEAELLVSWPFQQHEFPVTTVGASRTLIHALVLTLGDPAARLCFDEWRTSARIRGQRELHDTLLQSAAGEA